MNRNKLEYLLKEHHRDAFLWARQCCKYDSEDAKEVVQIVYLKILEGKAKFKEKSAFKTWLFSIVRYTAIDYFKHKIVYGEIKEFPEFEDETEEFEEINYKEILRQLPERQQQVLLLSFYHGMTLAEIATVTQLHIGTVRTHYERGKEKLRSLILEVRNE